MSTAPSDLRQIERSSAPNDALACPPDVCRAEADVESPLFDLDAERLGGIVRQVISGQPRTELVAEDPEINQMVFVQKSRVFRFADTIRIQIVEIPPRTSILMHSRSNVGYWDLGVNRQRVADWIAAIGRAAQDQ